MYTHFMKNVLLISIPLLTDINECELGTPCDPNANCTDTVGSFDCFCNTGYTGNGLVCTSKYFGGHIMIIHTIILEHSLLS